MSGGHSLIRREEAQLDLLPSSEIEGVDFAAEEAAGIYTGERLFRDRPEVYRAVCSLLAEGVPSRVITRLCKVHHYTIQAVREREPGVIEAEKERIGRVARGVGRICIERLMEVLPDMELKDLGDAQRVAVIFGIVSEKSELLTGGATARVDHGSEGLADMRQALQALPADPEPIEGEFSEVPAQTTGLGGGMCAAKREAGEAVEGADLGGPESGSGEEGREAAHREEAAADAT